MQTPVLPPNEIQRVQALHDAAIVGTPPEERFDRLTRLAQQIFQVPIALVSLVDTDRQWFKSKQGLDVCETARDVSFCGHAILGDDIFEVPDARLDARFADNPLVMGAPHIRFYAGAPLTLQSGFRVGTLCLIADKPRHLTARERQILRDLADCVVAEIHQIDWIRQSESLAMTQKLGDIITRAQSSFIRESDRSKAFDNLLVDLLSLTHSEYGFVGEILYKPDGNPYLKTYAITNIAWSEETRAFYEAHAPQGMEFTNLNTLFGAAMTTGRPVIANDPYHDPRRGGLPHGHPPLNAFLGVPIYHGGEMLAMFGLANRPGGYDDQLVAHMQPLIATIGQLVHAARVRQQHQQVQGELARLSRVASETTNGVVITDAQGRVEWINDGFTRISGYTLDDLFGRKPGDLLQGVATDPHTRATMREALAQQQGFDVEVVNYTKAGQLYWVRINCTPLCTAHGELQGYMAIESDITLQRQSEQALWQFKSTLDQTLDSVFMFDAESLQFHYVNEGAARHVGYDSQELLALHPYDIKPHLSEVRFREMIAPLLAGEQVSLTFDTVHRHKDGHDIPVEVFLQYVAPPGERAHFVAIVRDMTERAHNEAKLRHLATHDALTGLPNRTLFIDRLTHAIAWARREQRRVCVYVLDLDNFKVVNDSYGHLQGDVLLTEVARRLSTGLRAGDTIARLGGDEYAAVLMGLDDEAQALAAAHRFMALLREPIWIQDREITPAASIGYCWFPDHGDDPQTLLRHADAAMYAAKSAGRGGVAAYREEIGGFVEENLHILTRVRMALDQGGFELHYQPQVDALSGRMVGVEALLRWNDAELGPVSPARFIPVAEASGLILPLGDWVLDHACRQVTEWHTMGIALPMAVNLSPYQFRQTDLVKNIQVACARHGCPVELLELEITESAAMQSPELTTRQLQALTEAGFSVALDDFGTGHSSLARLGQLHVDKLKIDRSFIEQVPGHPQYESLVRMTIGLARELGMQLVAEGVETDAQRQFLVEHGCAVYQGWLFSKAVPASAIVDLLSEPRTKQNPHSGGFCIPSQTKHQ